MWVVIFSKKKFAEIDFFFIFLNCFIFIFKLIRYANCNKGMLIV